MSDLSDDPKADSGLGTAASRVAALQAEIARLRAEVAELSGSAAREAQIRLVADSLPVLISYVDAAGRYRYNNRAYEGWFGVRRRDLYGRHLSEVLGEDAYEELRPLVEQTLSGERVSAQRQLYYKDGSARYVQIEYVPDRRDDGTVVGFYALIRDVSESSRAEQLLRESEARFRAMADSAPAPVWVTGDEGIEFVNAAMLEFVGRPADALLGDVWMEHVHPDDLAPILERRSLAWVERIPYSFAARFRRADGAWRWLHASCKPRIDGAGHFKGYVGLAVDFTDMHRAQAELREESRTLETLNRAGIALAAELDLQRLVQMVTDAGVELSGAQVGAFFYNVEDERGESYMLYTISGVDRSLFDKFPMPRNTAVFAPTFSGEGAVRSDDITKDPRYGKSDTHHGMPKEHLPVCSYLAVPVVSRSGEVIGGLFFGHPEPARFTQRHETLLVGIAAQAAVAIDNARLFAAAQREIAERSRTQQALAELNQSLEQRVEAAIAEREQAEAALRQSQKMEAVGQLTGGIAHDFNNLLTVIAGNLDLAERRLGPAADPRILRPITNALVGAERAAALTQRLLAFSRRQPLDPKPINANDLIGGMIELLHRTLGETVTVETRFGEVATIEVDPHQLESAILNLAVNARDAMRPGGRLAIATENVRIETESTIGELAPGDYVRIEVSDTGIGMSPETLSRAIEPFFTTKEVGKGTGLGLSMVYGFVRQSGGDLGIESEEGSGTSIAIYLPRSDQTIQGETGAIVSPPRAQQAEDILVCEDDADVRAFTVELLGELGYAVTEARDAAETLAILSDPGRRVALLFTDVVLPGGTSGAALAEQARAIRPDLRILYTTGYARDALAGDGRIGTGIDLITKPFTAADLGTRVREILDRR